MRGGQEQDPDVGDVHFDRPFGIGFDARGNYYMVTLNGNQVCRHTPENSRHKFFTVVAGNGTKGNSGDNGDARKALLNNPHNLLVLPSGDLYVADTLNNPWSEPAKLGLPQTTCPPYRPLCAAPNISA